MIGQIQHLLNGVHLTVNKLQKIPTELNKIAEAIKGNRVNEEKQTKKEEER